MVEMKRLIIIVCCFFVISAGIASAWADCRKLSSVSDQHDNSQRALPAHEDHSDSRHDHSHGAVMHCATLDDFLLTSVFSLTKDNRVHRTADFIVAALNFQLMQHVSGWFIHGPPGLSQPHTIPPYLLLTVMRV